MKLFPTFRDSAYPDALRAYAHGEIGQKAWDELNKRPLFQVWLRSVLRRHPGGGCEIGAAHHGNKS